MAKKKNTKKSATKSVVRTAKVDELKLGKFADAEPMRLPEGQVRRGWQIIGGIVLLFISGYAVVMMATNVPFAYLAWGGVDLWSGEQLPLTIAWIVNNVALVLFTILCLMTSILLFAKRRVGVVIWYALIVLLVVGFVSQSVGIYENYTTRECVKETCPMVVGELAVVLICDLLIMMLSILLLFLVSYVHKKQYRHKK